MARTGRFGRLPSAAPDLSSTIESLLEQWQNARDANILEAWKNGGEFEGKKVTDSRILAYYRKRRDAYDRTDPEWDSWNNDLWQMRFTVSDERYRMAYARGRIGPRAMAAHYRDWAQKMPRNSSFYRTTMAVAGQFEQAARAARAKRKKQFDYEAMNRHIDAIYKRDIKPSEDLFSALTAVAQKSGILEPGEDLFSAGLTTMEGNDLLSVLATVGEDTADWRTLKRSLDRFIPGWGESPGDLSFEDLDRLGRKAIKGINEQNEVYDSAPSDMRSYIKQNNQLKKRYQAMSLLDNRLDIDSAYRIAHMAHVQNRTDGWQRDPNAVLDGDAAYVTQLEKLERRYTAIGDYGKAGSVHMEILALQGDVEAVQATGATPLYAIPGQQSASFLQEATGTRAVMNMQASLENGTAYLQRTNDPATNADLQGMLTGTNVGPGFDVQPIPLVNGVPQFSDPSVFVTVSNTKAGSTALGKVKGYPYVEVFAGKVIVGPDGATPVAWVADINGHRQYRWFTANDQGGMDPHSVAGYDPLSERGLQLAPNPNGGDSWVIVMPQGGTVPDLSTLFDEVQNRTPGSVLDALTNGVPAEPPAGASPDEVAAYEQAQEDWDQAVDYVNSLEPQDRARFEGDLRQHGELRTQQARARTMQGQLSSIDARLQDPSISDAEAADLTRQRQVVVAQLQGIPEGLGGLPATTTPGAVGADEAWATSGVPNAAVTGEPTEPGVLTDPALRAQMPTIGTGNEPAPTPSPAAAEPSTTGEAQQQSDQFGRGTIIGSGLDLLAGLDRWVNHDVLGYDSEQVMRTTQTPGEFAQWQQYQQQVASPEARAQQGGVPLSSGWLTDQAVYRAFNEELTFLNDGPLSASSTVMANATYDAKTFDQYDPEHLPFYIQAQAMESGVNPQNLPQIANEWDSAFHLKSLTGSYDEAQRALAMGDVIRAQAALETGDQQARSESILNRADISTWVMQERALRGETAPTNAFAVDALARPTGPSDIQGPPVPDYVRSDFDILGRFNRDVPGDMAAALPTYTPSNKPADIAQQQPTVTVPDFLKPQTVAPPRVPNMPARTVASPLTQGPPPVAVNPPTAPPPVSGPPTIPAAAQSSAPPFDVAYRTAAPRDTGNIWDVRRAGRRSGF